MKKKAFQTILVLVSVPVFGYAIYYIYLLFLFAYEGLQVDNNPIWIAACGILVLLFPWELFKRLKIFALIFDMIKQLGDKIALPRPAFDAIPMKLFRMTFWSVLYAVVLSWIVNYFMRNRVGLALPILPWLFNAIVLSTFIFVSVIFLLRAAVIEIIGRHKLEKVLNNSFLCDYPPAVSLGACIAISLVMTLLSSFLLDRYNSSVTVIPDSNTPLKKFRMKVFINELDLSTSTVKAEVDTDYGIDVNLWNGNQWTSDKYFEEPYVFSIIGDSYYYPFSKYKLLMFYTVSANRFYNLIDPPSPYLVVQFIENSRLFELSNPSDNNAPVVVLSLAPYYKLLVVTIFFVLVILLLIIWGTKDRNTLIQLVVGIFAMLLTMRGFLIPWDLKQPLFIDQVILLYIVILMVTILLKLTRKTTDE